MFGSTTVPSVQQSQTPFAPTDLAPFVFALTTDSCSSSFKSVVVSTEPFHPCLKSLGTCSCRPRCACFAPTAVKISPAYQIAPNAKFSTELRQSDSRTEAKSFNGSSILGLCQIEDVIWSIDISYYGDLELTLEYYIWGPDGVTIDEFRDIEPPYDSYCGDCGRYGHHEAFCPDNVGVNLSGDENESGESYDEEDDKAFYEDFICGEDEDQSNPGTEWESFESEGDSEKIYDHDDASMSNDDSVYEIIGKNGYASSDGEDDGSGCSADELPTDDTNVGTHTTPQKTLRAAARPWYPSSTKPIATSPAPPVETLEKVTLEIGSKPRPNTATQSLCPDNLWSPPPVVQCTPRCDSVSLAANMFKWNKLEKLRQTNRDYNFSARCCTARKSKTQECFCGLKVIVGTCWHYGTNYGRRSLVCSNGICRFMEVLPGNHYGFEEPLAVLPLSRKQSVTFFCKSALPKSTPRRKTSHRYDPLANQPPTLATFIKTPVINVLARPLDESPAVSVVKTWAVQILDGPYDVLQMARLLKVGKKVRTRRARQRSAVSKASEKTPSCRQPTVRPCAKIKVRGLSGLERRRLARRKRVRRPCITNATLLQVAKLNGNKNERSCSYPYPVLPHTFMACVHMFLRLGGVWLSTALVRGQLP